MKLSRESVIAGLNADEARYARRILSDDYLEYTEDTIARKVKDGFIGATKIFKAFGRDGFMMLCGLTDEGLVRPTVSVPILEAFAIAESEKLAISLRRLPYLNVPVIGRFVSRMSCRCFPDEMARRVFTEFLCSNRGDYRRFAFSEIDHLLRGVTEPLVELRARTFFEEQVAIVDNSICGGGEDAIAALHCCAAYRDDPFLTMLKNTVRQHASRRIRTIATGLYLSVFDVRSKALLEQLVAGENIITLLADVIQHDNDEDKAEAIGTIFAFGLETVPVLEQIIAYARKYGSPIETHAIAEGEDMVARRWA